VAAIDQGREERYGKIADTVAPGRAGCRRALRAGRNEGALAWVRLVVAIVAFSAPAVH
jgi:hypothetical protein